MCLSEDWHEDGVGIADGSGNVKVVAYSVFSRAVFVFLSTQLDPYGDMSDLLKKIGSAKKSLSGADDGSRRY